MQGNAFAQTTALDSLFSPADSPPQLDLRGHDWLAVPTISLDGRFAFATGLHTPDRLSADSGASAGNLWERHGHDPDRGEPLHQGTYSFQILVDPHLPVPLGISLEEVLTAYEIWVNGHLIGGNGHVGADESTTLAALAPKCYALPVGADTLDIVIACANYEHRQAGITTAPVIGNLPVIMLQKTTRTTIGGILIGLLLMGSLYQFVRYLHRRQEIGFLVNGIWCLMVALHISFLHERWAYQLLGDGHWGIAYRLELVTLFLTFIISFVFLRVFFQGMRPMWLWWVLMATHSLVAVFALLAPMPWANQIDRFIPMLAISVIVFWAIGILDAYRRRIDGWKEILAATIAIFLATLSDRFMYGEHVGSLLPPHYFFSGYIFVSAWILSRRSATAEHQVIQLGADLAASNQALEAQNEQLEVQVQERTAELVQAQQATHNLEMEQVRRDLESLSANNQMKVQLSRNLIDELQAILQTGGDYPMALKSLIASLRGQVATEERLGVLQDDFDAVNAEFYRRLQARHPQLSKSEREICAYIKLNLSGKDIAQLRKTSSNTINVARHRIRKKLELERDEELEAYVQGI